MLKKYNEFKKISVKDMKEIKGGYNTFEVTQCYSCTEGSKEWGFGCPSRPDCKCFSC
jgi:hypothetical protein